jgi:2-iminobutanoate/2-iminopropanoate deaminase
MRIDPKSVPLSLARRAGDLLFLSGQIAFDDDGKITGAGIAEQTRQVFKNIRGVLEQNGVGLRDVVNATVWLANKDDFLEFNRMYAEYFPSLPPARTTVVSQLLAGALVEIAVVANAEGASWPFSRGSLEKFRFGQAREADRHTQLRCLSRGLFQP